MRVINFIGANATGKSTRTKVLVDHLMENFEYEPVEFTYTKRSKKEGDKVITSDVGLKFSNNWVIFGKFSGKENESWVGLDSGMCSSWDQRSAFVQKMKDDGVDTVFFEGYFNNRSKIAGPETFRNAGADEVHILVSYYDDVNEFLERTNVRSGRLHRGLDWAENAPGWKDNKGIINSQKYWNEQSKEGDTVTRIDINEPREYIVHRFLDKNYKYTPFVPKKEVNDMDEWL